MISECKPASECDPVSVSMEDNTELLPGMVKRVNDTGCCPSLSIICQPETCPAPPLCAQYMELSTRPGVTCCPSYECVLPPHTCIHEFEYTTSEHGGERHMRDNEKYTALKHVGEVWQDGPCRRCECIVADSKSHCALTYCPHQPVSSDYVLTPEYTHNACCPQYKAEACKHHEQVYSVGSTWYVTPGDYCKNLTCVTQGNGDVSKVETVETCNTECALGWRYESSAHTCCGQCVPHACAVASRVYEEGAVWYSEDKCIQYSCERMGKQYHIVSTAETCPVVSHCPENKLYQDGCCEKCNHTIEDLSSCYPELVDAASSIRAVSHLVFDHGECTNKEPIPNLTQCRGACPTGSTYNTYSSTYESKCQCCQAIEYTMIDVMLDCEDSYELKHSIHVPSKCLCNACGSGELPQPRMIPRVEKLTAL